MDAPRGTELTPISELPLPEKLIGEGWTILYTLGSYAPAHRNHMELLVLARALCEQRGLRVAAIMVAPTADHSLREKLGYLPLPLEARYLCLRLLIANTPGLAGIPVLIDRYLAEGRIKGAGAASAHLEAEVKERYHGRVYVRAVFGLDALTKIRSRHAIENGIIVLNRKSSEVGDNPDEFVARHPHAQIIRYIASPNWKEATLSSTKLRAMYMRGEDISGETHPEFVAFLRAKNIVLAPTTTSAAATPFPELVANLYQPRTATGAALPLAAGWNEKVPLIPFHELSPAAGLLGQGRQAHTTMMNHAGVRVAVKRCATVRQSDLRIIARELYLLARLKPHPHVVGLLGAGSSPEGFLYMVLQLAAGSASARLAADPPYMVHEPHSPDSIGWIRVLHHVALGMAHVHACGILHRDLSADNVLLSGEPSEPTCCAMVADFGVSKETRDSGPIARGACRKYAPEALGTDAKPDHGQQREPQEYIYIEASDVFMFACLAYEILCGHVYFSERNTSGACTGTLAGERPILPASQELKLLTELITHCWAQRAADRPTFVVIAERLKRLLDNLVALKASPAV